MAKDNLTAVLYGIEDLRLVRGFVVEELLVFVLYFVHCVFRNNVPFQRSRTMKFCWKWTVLAFADQTYTT